MWKNISPPAAPAENVLFAGLRADQVTGIEIIPAGAREISVSRTNKTWRLEKPFAYPAQAAAIEGLLGALEKLSPVMAITAAEMSGRKNADAEFGFENPQFTLDLAAGEQHLASARRQQDRARRRRLCPRRGRRPARL